MDRLMELLNDGRAWSVADLANSLREPQKEVQRRVESLESNGYLRKACGCGPQCKGCGHCGTHSPHALAFLGAPRTQETPKNFCLYIGTPFYSGGAPPPAS